MFMFGRIIQKDFIRQLVRLKLSKYLQVSTSNFCSQKSDGADSKEPDYIEKGGKFRIFKDEDAPIILDVEEERTQYCSSVGEQEVDEFEGINLKRGDRGVFEIEDLISLLKRDKAQDIFVVRVPKELNYVDYMVIVSGKSKRHILGMAEFVRKVYKKKRHPKDVIPQIEGVSLSQWLAMDLGNIAVHLMLSSTRERFDLETLWSVGASFDPASQPEEDSLEKLLNDHSVSLDQFHPSVRLS